MMLSKTLAAVLALTACAWASGPLVIDTPILDANSGEAIEDFGSRSGQPESFIWSTNIAAGTSVSCLIIDATGFVAQSAPFTIQPGTSPFTIDTPSEFIQCEKTKITWSGGEAPFLLEFQRGHVDVESFGVNSRTFTWSTNVPAGEQFQILLHDVTGQVAESAMFVIQPGCLRSRRIGSSLVLGWT
ncbi:uncharacterized protein TRAVEDRAFT_24771 [Trametes versicolor FP-101664 SS1]|uniref:Uncharacterized protein n=1 Tax=Trametes versicolor (strain FP-101664) TaxID=717944 RepID=R7SB00_TRAVS|nr:uncharacterized protein TRAVEDRAFT_24771 [Trametes versicolor FP-101664 SS1]EIW52089.1 hypothetical protein TRAVEDRAFT_24771 [Trametes versicolor FP-101664 SS1]